MKNTREVAMEYRMAQWTEVMRERQSSGLSIIGYCRQEGIKPDRYFYWQRKLRKAAMNTISPMANLELQSTETVAEVPAGWTQVTTIKDSHINNESHADKTKNGSEVIIDIGKCRVTVNDAMKTELLSKVCKVLVELC